MLLFALTLWFTEASARSPKARDIWPMPRELHPAVESAKKPPTTVAGWAKRIAKEDLSQSGRAKAAFDVASRIAYDPKAMTGGDIGSQAADDVLARGTASCQGYTNLYQALGEALGLEVVTIIGKSRSAGVQFDKSPHAWNAVKLNGQWILVDPTWGAGDMFGLDFNPDYNPAWFAVPPRIFAEDHIPSDAKWQLLERPVVASEIVGTGMVSAEARAEGVKVSEKAAVNGTRWKVTLDNPRQRYVMALARREPREGATVSCGAPGTDKSLTIECKLAPGEWVVELYMNEEAGGSFDAVAFWGATVP